MGERGTTGKIRTGEAPEGALGEGGVDDGGGGGSAHGGVGGELLELQAANGEGRACGRAHAGGGRKWGRRPRMQKAESS